jgi:hypothetical protein
MRNIGSEAAGLEYGRGMQSFPLYDPGTTAIRMADEIASSALPSHKQNSVSGGSFFDLFARGVCKLDNALIQRQLMYA